MKTEEKNGINLWQGLLLFLSVYVLVVLFLSALKVFSPATEKVLDYIDTLICAVFFADFIYVIRKREDKWKYFFTWGWIDLLASIPNPAGLPGLSYLRAGRIFRLVRIIRLIRGARSAKHLLIFASENRARNTLAVVGGSCLVLTIFACIVIFEIEKGFDESKIKSVWDSLWWSFVTVATVGYGDCVPVSWQGKAFAILLMIAGTALFGTFTAYMASFFVEPAGKKEHLALMAELQEIKQRLAAIEKK